MKILPLLLAAALAFAAAPALAQVPPSAPVIGATINAQAVTASTSRAALPASAAYNALTINNYGVKDAFIALGGTTVTATTSSIPVRAGKHITIYQGTAVDIAAICGGSDTTTLDIYQATGPVNLGP